MEETKNLPPLFSGPAPQICGDGRVLFGTLFLAATGSFSVVVRSVSLEEVTTRSMHTVWSGWMWQCICSGLSQTCLQFILGLSGQRQSSQCVLDKGCLVCRGAWFLIPSQDTSPRKDWCAGVVQQRSFSLLVRQDVVVLILYPCLGLCSLQVRNGNTKSQLLVHKITRLPV